VTTADLLDDARRRLAGVVREPLGELVERRVLGIRRATRIVARGTAWHLGVLLLTDDGVAATGEIVRAREEAPRGFAAESQRARAALAGAAFRGGFAEGAAVHVGWAPIDIAAVDAGGESGPLAMHGGVVTVRWSRAGGVIPLAAYLDERIELALHPPQGAA
jgi:hypothetical protein